ncbi:MAG: 4-(cytidine 5'-diphospho)-2-C-methyl-D-erythritol kinase [Candidatus Hydrogenedentota bacterium]
MGTVPSVGVRCQSYAKINLYLDVLSRRDDGFHNIETLFQSVSLCDELDCNPAESGLTMRIEGSDLEADEDNLVMRAARRLHEQFNVAQGAELVLRKRIPVAAGLAGGSGDAAAALLGLNRLWDVNASIGELEAIAAKLGSDVPYCLHGGTMAGTGRGEHLKVLPAVEPSWFILAHPPISVSTPEIFNHPALQKSNEPLEGNGRSRPFNEAIISCARGRLPEVFVNTLESAALVAYPEIEGYKTALRDAGCSGVLMSGSGPTVFGLCDNEAHGKSIQNSLTSITASVVHTVDAGVVLEGLK